MRFDLNNLQNKFLSSKNENSNCIVRTLPSDGNCMFHALLVALGIENSPENILLLRKDIVAFIKANQAFFESSIAIDDVIMQEPEIVKKKCNQNDSKSLFESYIKHMGESGTYGTHLELTAFISMWNVPIIIHSDKIPKIIGFNDLEVKSDLCGDQLSRQIFNNLTIIKMPNNKFISNDYVHNYDIILTVPDNHKFERLQYINLDCSPHIRNDTLIELFFVNENHYNVVVRQTVQPKIPNFQTDQNQMIIKDSLTITITSNELCSDNDDSNIFISDSSDQEKMKKDILDGTKIFEHFPIHIYSKNSLSESFPSNHNLNKLITLRQCYFYPSDTNIYDLVSCYKIFITVTKEEPISHFRTIKPLSVNRESFITHLLERDKNIYGIVIETLIICENELKKKERRVAFFIIDTEIHRYDVLFKFLLKELHPNNSKPGYACVGGKDEIKNFKFISSKLRKHNHYSDAFIFKFGSEKTFINIPHRKSPSRFCKNPNQEIRSLNTLLKGVFEKMVNNTNDKLNNNFIEGNTIQKIMKNEIPLMNSIISDINETVLRHNGLISPVIVKEMIKTNFVTGEEYLKLPEAKSHIKKIRKSFTRTKGSHVRIKGNFLSYFENQILKVEDCLKEKNNVYELYYSDKIVNFCKEMTHCFIDSTVMESDMKKYLIVTVSTFIHCSEDQNKKKINNNDPNFYTYKTVAYFVFLNANIRKDFTVTGKSYKRTTITSNEYILIFDWLLSKFKMFKSITADFEKAISAAVKLKNSNGDHNINFWGCLVHFKDILRKHSGNISKQCFNIAKRLPFYNFSADGVIENCSFHDLLKDVNLLKNDWLFLDKIYKKYFCSEINYFNRNVFSKIDDQIEAFKLTNNAAERPNDFLKALGSSYDKAIISHINNQINNDFFVGRPKKRPKQLLKGNPFKFGMFVKSTHRFELREGNIGFMKAIDVYQQKRMKGKLECIKDDLMGNPVLIPYQEINSENINIIPKKRGLGQSDKSPSSYMLEKKQFKSHLLKNLDNETVPDIFNKRAKKPETQIQKRIKNTINNLQHSKEQERIEKEKISLEKEQERIAKEEALKRVEKERIEKEKALKREEQERIEKEEVIRQKIALENELYLLRQMSAKKFMQYDREFNKSEQDDKQKENNLKILKFESNCNKMGNVFCLLKWAFSKIKQVSKLNSNIVNDEYVNDNCSLLFQKQSLSSQSRTTQATIKHKVKAQERQKRRELALKNLKNN